MLARRLLPGPRLAVALKCLPFALHAGELGPRRGQHARGFVARLGERFLARLLHDQRRAQAAPGVVAACSTAARVAARPLRVALCRKRAAQGRPAVEASPSKPRQPRFGLAHFRRSHAPFGLDPGMVRGRLGQCQFGSPPRAFRVFGRPLGLACSPASSAATRGLAAGQILFESPKRFGCIAGQPVGFEAIFLEPLLLPVEVGEPLLGRLEAGWRAPPCGAVRAGVVAPVGEFVAYLGQLFRGRCCAFCASCAAFCAASTRALGLFGLRRAATRRARRRRSRQRAKTSSRASAWLIFSLSAL